VPNKVIIDLYLILKIVLQVVRMKKQILVLFIVLSLCGCSFSDDREVTQIPTESAQTQLIDSSPTAIFEPTPTPEPTPPQPVKSVALPIAVAKNEQFLMHVSDSIAALSRG
jgi:hypothetical protein